MEWLSMPPATSTRGYVFDTHSNGRVVVLSPSGTLLHAFPNASNPNTSNYRFNEVVGVAVDSSRNIYVANQYFTINQGIGRVVVLSPSGVLLYVVQGVYANYVFDYIGGVAVDTLLVTSTYWIRTLMPMTATVEW
jgi:uncharacterized protein affecting Mg2+/Co2+ transport